MRVKRSMRRDSQRSKVYRAEDGAYTETLPQLEDWGAMCAWHNNVMRSADLAQEFGVNLESVELKKTTGGWASNATAQRISLGRIRHTDRRTYLHELAHTIMARQPVRRGVGVLRPAAHGPEWCGVLLRLVEWFQGPAARKELSEAFITARVRIVTWNKFLHARHNHPESNYCA